MNGERDIETLLTSMKPVLHEVPYVFISIGQDTYETMPFDPLGVFHEEEGITVIATQHEAESLGVQVASTWACVTLTVHSALSAVGFLAAIAGKLASQGISVNPVSACYHDHLFVPWESRLQAMNALRELIKAQ